MAAAHGVVLDDTPEQRYGPSRVYPDHRPSILQDYELGRPMEIESYQGMLACVIAGSGVALMAESMLASLPGQKLIDRMIDGDLLTGATPVTVFAPSDDAFRAVPVNNDFRVDVAAMRDMSVAEVKLIVSIDDPRARERAVVVVPDVDRVELRQLPQHKPQRRLAHHRHTIRPLPAHGRGDPGT